MAGRLNIGSVMTSPQSFVDTCTWGNDACAAANNIGGVARTLHIACRSVAAMREQVLPQ